MAVPRLVHNCREFSRIRHSLAGLLVEEKEFFRPGEVLEASVTELVFVFLSVFMPACACVCISV